MSLAFEESSPTFATSDKHTSANYENRQSHRLSIKTRTIRLDSPTTIEACRELGILVETLKPKNFEDFKEPGLEEEIVELRYNYYTKRYTQNIKDVYARKRQLVRARQKQERIQAEQQQQSPEHSGTKYRQRSVETGAASARLPGESNNYYGSMRQSASSGKLLLSGPVMSSYNKALSYVRRSHDTAEVKDMQEIIGSRDQFDVNVATEEFDGVLAQEISRFNKLKRQKQKEAKDVFDEEIKRIKLVEDLTEREKRKKEREKKQVVEQKKAEEERRAKAEEKLEKIRETEKLYQSMKMKEKVKIQKKLEVAHLKYAEEAAERRRLLAEQEERLSYKRKIAEEKRVKLKEDEQAKCDRLKIDITQKIQLSSQKHNYALSERTTRVKFQIQKIEESAKRIKVKQEQDNEEHVQQLVEKLVKKEESFKAFQNQHHKDLKKKETEATEKHRRLHSHQIDLRQLQKGKALEINERFMRVQENLEQKREQDEKNLRVKHEQNRLKMTDKQENYNRQIRQMQYEQQKFIERQKHNQEKLLWLKNHKNVLQQAKVEVSIQSKIERERISQEIQQLSKVTHETASSSKLTDQQKKILKRILKPEDFRTLEDENRMKMQAQIEADARRKSVGGIPNQQW